MKITVDVSKVIVICGRGPDKVCINLNLPDASYPYAQDSLAFRFEAAAGTGKRFVKRYFEIPDKLIEEVHMADVRVPFSASVDTSHSF